jgi:hypothetical protein
MTRQGAGQNGPSPCHQVSSLANPRNPLAKFSSGQQIEDMLDCVVALAGGAVAVASPDALARAVDLDYARGVAELIKSAVGGEVEHLAGYSTAVF